jgi:hypothetical protein
LLGSPAFRSLRQAAASNVKQQLSGIPFFIVLPFYYVPAAD